MKKQKLELKKLEACGTLCFVALDFRFVSDFLVWVCVSGSPRRGSQFRHRRNDFLTHDFDRLEFMVSRQTGDEMLNARLAESPTIIDGFACTHLAAAEIDCADGSAFDLFKRAADGITRAAQHIEFAAQNIGIFKCI